MCTSGCARAPPPRKERGRRPRDRPTAAAGRSRSWITPRRMIAAGEGTLCSDCMPVGAVEALLQFIELYVLWFVVICGLLDQCGLPTPAYPPIIVTSALAVEGGRSLVGILLVAVLAAVMADVLWYACGRRFGTTMLRLMCRIS